MKKKKTMLLLVLALAIGFASVSTTLIINGTVGVEKNDDNFVKGVVFDEESLSSSTGTTAEISESGRTITFVTQEMKSVDETATVNFKIKNYSQYNAVLGTPAISCYFVNEHQVDTVDETTPKVTTNEYMQLIPGSELNGVTITAGGGLSAESRVTVKQIKSYVGEPISIKFQCVINATAGESETPSITKPPVYTVTFNSNGGDTIENSIRVESGKAYGELPTPTKEGYDFLGWYTSTGEKVISTTTVNKPEDHTLTAKWGILMPQGYYLINDTDTSGTITVGDEIQVGTESFYVISHTDWETKALAKYNLMVGYETDSSYDLTPLTNPTGIQDPSARGWVDGADKLIGTANFSDLLDGPYENNETIDLGEFGGPVYDALYGTNGYESYIQKTIPSATVRLIENAELESLGCSSTEKTCKSSKYDWLYYTSYWTQSAAPAEEDIDDVFVWVVGSDGSFNSRSYLSFFDYGVRPVITIPLS